MLQSFLKHLAVHEQECLTIAERFYSQVYRMGARIIKISNPHKDLCPEGFTTKSEASNFATEVLTYMEKLAGLDVPVSSVLHTKLHILHEEKTGRPFVAFDVPDGGVSVESLLAEGESHHALRELARGMIRAFLPVFFQERLESKYHEVGIDPIPSNFALADGRMTYIDFTPPRYFSPDRGYRVEYPQPADETELRDAIRRYYEPYGIVTRWLTDCCRIRPDGRDIFLGVMRQLLPDALWDLVNRELGSLHLPSDLRTPEWPAAIRSASQSTDLRDFACAIAAADGSDPSATREWLHQFFTASRHHPGQPIPDGTLDILQSKLLDRLKLASI